MIATYPMIKRELIENAKDLTRICEGLEKNFGNILQGRNDVPSALFDPKHPHSMTERLSYEQLKGEHEWLCVDGYFSWVVWHIKFRLDHMAVLLKEYETAKKSGIDPVYLAEAVPECHASEREKIREKEN